MGQFRRSLLSNFTRLCAAVAVFATLASCDLNPQPEVPGAAGTGGGKKTSGGGGGAGGSSGGSGGTGAVLGTGGTPPGGTGGTGGTAGMGTPCNAACGANQLCYNGDCLDDPCVPNSCQAEQACKPNADFTAANCTPSCAGVVCNRAQTCVDGQCVATGCKDGCASGEVCLSGGDGGSACGPDPCLADGGVTCLPGEICDSKTGGCVTDPCYGVKCPTEQACILGQCEWSGDAGADAAGD